MSVAYEKRDRTGASRAAAKSVERDAPRLRERVYRFLQGRGELGATDDEIELASKMSHQTISARRRELVLEGKVVASGRKRPTRSGRAANVWIIDPTYAAQRELF